MTGEEVLAKQKAECEAQIGVHSDLQEHLMNSDCTLGSRVEHPINKLQGITTLVPTQEDDCTTSRK